MKCINFDERFERYATDWMRKNAAKYQNNLDRMEAKMPEVYLQWLNQPAEWLDGETPGGYFLRYTDPEALISWMREYYRRKVPVPDQLLERLTALGPGAERALLSLLADESAPEEARLTAISLLSEMESAAPRDQYIAWIARRQERDERADLAAEALIAMGRPVVPAVLRAVGGATRAGRETFLDILCNFPGEEAIYALAISMFEQDPSRRALYASFLGKLGDARALDPLREAIEDASLSYLDFIELRNAMEALGGEAPAEREFAGDPYYETMRRMD